MKTQKSGNGSKSAPSASPASNGDTSATATEAPKQLDKAKVRQLFGAVFQFKKDIEAEETALREKRKQSSALLEKVLEATNGATGPFLIDGRKYTIAHRTVKPEATGEGPAPAPYKLYYLRAPEEHVATEL